MLFLVDLIGSYSLIGGKGIKISFSTSVFLEIFSEKNIFMVESLYFLFSGSLSCDVRTRSRAFLLNFATKVFVLIRYE